MVPRIVTVALLTSAALAVLTNRWVALSGPTPAFNIVSFRSFFFLCQWVGMAISLAVVVVCIWQRPVSWRLYAGLGLVVFYLAGGVLTSSADRWATGESSPAGWWRARRQDRGKRALQARFAGRWQAEHGVWTMTDDSVTAPGCRPALPPEIVVDTPDRLLTPAIRARLGTRLPSVPPTVLTMDVSCPDVILTLVLVAEDRIVMLPWPKGDPEVLRRIGNNSVHNEGR